MLAYGFHSGWSLAIIYKSLQRRDGAVVTASRQTVRSDPPDLWFLI
jgi:hypothetical protein